MTINEIIKWAKTKNEPFNSRMVSNELNITISYATGILTTMMKNNIVKKIRETKRDKNGLHGALYILNTGIDENIKIRREKGKNFSDRTANLIISCFKKYNNTPISSKLIQDELSLSISTVNDCLIELREKNIIKTVRPFSRKTSHFSTLYFKQRKDKLYERNKTRTH